MKCSLAWTVTAFCGVLYCTVTSWQRCFHLGYFYVYELPAVCSEGRPLHDVLANGEIIVDDTHEDDDGQVTMLCQVPIFVYYRHKDLKARNEAESQWVLPVRKKQSQDVSLEKWRQRTVAVDVMCNRNGHPNLGAYYPHCSKPEWQCFHGKCTAYEKTRRLCAGQITEDPYSCYYIPGDPGVGTEGSRASFPFLSLAISLVATIWLLQWCWLLVVTIKRECQDGNHLEDWRANFLSDSIFDSFAPVGAGKKWIFCFLGSVFLFGFLYSRIFHVTAQPDEDLPKGKVTYGIGDISKGSLKAEQPVPVSFWTLRWQPSPTCQVVILSLASICTMLYQRWLKRKVKEERYASMPQGPHRRASVVFSTWRPQELECEAAEFQRQQLEMGG